MSIQSARDFLAKVAGDEGLRNQLGGGKTRDQLLQIAQGAGFQFTRDEINTARNELQDAELDQVSGAGCCPCESDICTGLET